MSTTIQLGPRDIEKALDMLEPQLQHFSDELDKPDAPLVRLVEELLELMMKHDLIFYLVISSDHVGVHFDNRAGLGVVPSECDTLVSNICSHGYSLKEVDPIASEVPPPDHPRAQMFIDFN